MQMVKFVAFVLLALMPWSFAYADVVFNQPFENATDTSSSRMAVEWIPTVDTLVKSISVGTSRSSDFSERIVYDSSGSKLICGTGESGCTYYWDVLKEGDPTDSANYYNISSTTGYTFQAGQTYFITMGYGSNSGFTRRGYSSDVRSGVRSVNTSIPIPTSLVTNSNIPDPLFSVCDTYGLCAFEEATTTSSRILDVTVPAEFVINGSHGAVPFSFTYVSNTPVLDKACIYLQDLTNGQNLVPVCTGVTTSGVLTYSNSLSLSDDTAYSWRAVLLDSNDVEVSSSQSYLYSTGESWTDLIGNSLDFTVASSGLSSQELSFSLEQSQSYCEVNFPYDDSDIIQATVTYLPNALCRIISWTSAVPESVGVNMSSFAVSLFSIPPFNFIEKMRGNIESL